MIGGVCPVVRRRRSPSRGSWVFRGVPETDVPFVWPPPSEVRAAHPRGAEEVLLAPRGPGLVRLVLGVEEVGFCSVVTR